MATINHLGPYDVCNVTDAILGYVVYNQEVPIVIKQTIDNKTTYAVLAKDRNVRSIACAGCFKADMRITDSTRRKKLRIQKMDSIMITARKLDLISNKKLQPTVIGSRWILLLTA